MIRGFLTPETVAILMSTIFFGIIIGYPLGLVIGIIGLVTGIRLWRLDMIQPHG